ncbi:UNVERIFIED_CONTAM: hypothetical protein HDU68_011896 [Siphonaria sp. JEL0065]|nr:hypothetical protein HDU68_011896 [Siphonaria sp. JEL0065]
MERAVAFDLFAATRPADLTNSTNTSSLQGTTASRPASSLASSTTVSPAVNKSKSLHTSLDRVLAVYQKTNGSESHIHNQHHTNNGLLTPMRPTSPLRTGSRGRTRSGGGSGRVWRGMDRGAGMFMVTAVSEAVVASGVGGVHDAPGIVLARTMLGNIHSTINRLNTYLPVNLPRPTQSIKSPTSPTTSLTTTTSTAAAAAAGLEQFPAAPFQWNGTSINLYIWSLIVYTGHQIWNATKLYALAKVCVQVFEVREEERATIEAGVVGGLAGSDDYYSPTSGVWGSVVTPDMYKKDKLRVTAAGRMQIKLGLRKSDPKSVPVRENERARSLVMSYEYEWVVKVVGWVARKFDYYYPNLSERAPYLPKNAGLYWLRFFAAKQNLLFTLAVVCIGYVVFGFLWWLLFSVGDSTASDALGGVYARQQQEALYRRQQQAAQRQNKNVKQAESEQN